MMIGKPRRERLISVEEATRDNSLFPRVGTRLLTLIGEDH